jgi:DNA-binding transcriptional regulator YiaG
MKLVLALRPGKKVNDAFAIAHLLVDTSLSPRGARRAIDELADGKIAYVEAPRVADFEHLKRDLARHGVTLHRIEPRPVDVKALRERLGISQEAFAGRYCLDVATVRNWEQGRTTPEGPAAALLQLIDRDPDKVVELLAS